MQMPKVLIFGQPFNNRHGGGITLSNLFKDWDKDRLAVAASGHVMYNVTTDVCETYYQLGSKEYRWRFPFRYLQRKFHSGLLRIDRTGNAESGNKELGLRYYFVNSIFYPALEWLGIYHCAAVYSMSDQFKTWLKDYNPQILYLQVSSYDTIVFARQLQNFLEIPSVLHMMDDWPSTISQKGPFRKVWEKKIDRELRSLMDKSSLLLSISDAMSDEYFRRYNKVFVPFHNPIDTKVWAEKRKLTYSFKDKIVRILYSGRIGPGITDSLVEIAETLDEIAIPGITLKFHIQSPSANPEIIKSLLKFQCTVLNPIADYSELPEIYSNADILLIANDFDQKGLAFLLYSMPTKASEYMISGTPVLVYSPSLTAVSKFFSQNECGCCVTDKNRTTLKQSITNLVTNEEYRKSLGNKANMLAIELFNAELVRSKFHHLLTSLLR